MHAHFAAIVPGITWVATVLLRTFVAAFHAAVFNHLFRIR